MMRTACHWPLIALVGAVIAVGPAQAKEPRVFSAASAWAMNYADDSCQLSRDFAREGEIITLAFQRFQPGDTVELALASDELTRAPGEFTTKFRFAPDAVRFEAQQFQGELEDGRDYFGIGPAGSASPRLRSATSRKFSTRLRGCTVRPMSSKRLAS